MTAIARLVGLALVAAALTGCVAAPTRPDLERLYRVGAANADATPLVIIPGLFGSKLRDRDTKVEVWPGKWNDILWSDYRVLALDFDPQTLAVRPDNLEAFDIAE